MSDASYDPSRYGLLGPIDPRLGPLVGLLGDNSAGQIDPRSIAGAGTSAATPTSPDGSAPASPTSAVPQAGDSPHGLFGKLGAAARSWWQHASQPDPVTGMTLGDKLRLLGADFRDFGEGTSTSPQVLQDINSQVMERAKLAMMRRQMNALGAFGGAAGVPGYANPGAGAPGGAGLRAPSAPPSGAVLPSAGIGGAPQLPTQAPRLPSPAPAVPASPVASRAGVPSMRDMYPTLAGLYAAGVDISPMVDVLKNAQPDVHEANGWTFDARDPNAAGRYFGAAPVAGAEPLFNQSGQHVGWRMADGAIKSLEDVEAAKAGAEAKAKAPYDFHMVKDASGREIPVSGARLAQDEHGAGVGNRSPAIGGPAGGGLGQSTADAEFDKASAGALSQRIDADTGARESALSAAQQAAQALDFVKTHPMNPAAPYKAEWANNLRALTQSSPTLGALLDSKRLDALAADPTTYQRLATQAQLEGAKTLLPTRYTERELQMLSHIYPGLSSPNDSAALFWAQYGAMANRKKAQADFASNYNGPKNLGAYTKAWSESPEGQRSIFQDPIWNGVTINGRPAVAYAERRNPKSGATERFGAFMPYAADGTPNPNAYVFRVR